LPLDGCSLTVVSNAVPPFFLSSSVAVCKSYT